MARKCGTTIVSTLLSFDRADFSPVDFSSWSSEKSVDTCEQPQAAPMKDGRLKIQDLRSVLEDEALRLVVVECVLPMVGSRRAVK